MKKKIVALTLLSCVLLLFSALTVAVASTVKISENVATGPTYSENNPTVLNASYSDTAQTTITPNSVTGQAKLSLISLGNRTMDADWTYSSLSGWITSLYAKVTFGDGIAKSETRSSTIMPVQYGSFQHQFATSGYHTATLTGYYYTDYILLNTVVPITSGIDV